MENVHYDPQMRYNLTSSSKFGRNVFSMNADDFDNNTNIRILRIIHKKSGILSSGAMKMGGLHRENLKFHHP